MIYSYLHRSDDLCMLFVRTIAVTSKAAAFSAAAGYARLRDFSQYPCPSLSTPQRRNVSASRRRRQPSPRRTLPREVAAGVPNWPPRSCWQEAPEVTARPSTTSTRSAALAFRGGLRVASTFAATSRSAAVTRDSAASARAVEAAATVHATNGAAVSTAVAAARRVAAASAAVARCKSQSRRH